MISFLLVFLYWQKRLITQHIFTATQMIALSFIQVYVKSTVSKQNALGQNYHFLIEQWFSNWGPWASFMGVRNIHWPCINGSPRLAFILACVCGSLPIAGTSSFYWHDSMGRLIGLHRGDDPSFFWFSTLNWRKNSNLEACTKVMTFFFVFLCFKLISNIDGGLLLFQENEKGPPV